MTADQRRCRLVGQSPWTARDPLVALPLAITQPRMVWLRLRCLVSQVGSLWRVGNPPGVCQGPPSPGPTLVGSGLRSCITPFPILRSSRRFFHSPSPGGPSDNSPSPGGPSDNSPVREHWEPAQDSLAPERGVRAGDEGQCRSVPLLPNALCKPRARVLGYSLSPSGLRKHSVVAAPPLCGAGAFTCQPVFPRQPRPDPLFPRIA